MHLQCLKRKKQIYVMPQNRMLFVYVEEPISKKAFIISVFSPAFILGIIPYGIWVFAAPVIPIPVSLSVVMYCICMSGCALGDYLNAFNCARQVPKGGVRFLTEGGIPIGYTERYRTVPPVLERKGQSLLFRFFLSGKKGNGKAVN